MTSYNPPSYYEKSLKELNKRYFSLLDSIAVLFPKKKLYPEFPAYSKPFNKEMNDLNTIQADFFLFNNDLESDIDHLDKEIRLVNDKIATIEKENKQLKAKLDSFRNSNDASYGMLEDTKLLYNQQLTGNWLLFFTLLGIMYSYKKL